MGIGKSVNDLKNGPKEDKVAVASGVAITIVVVLLAAWAIFFLKKIASGAQQVNLSGGAQDQFNFSSVKKAQQQLQDEYGNTAQDLQDLRAAAQSGQTSAQVETVQQQTVNSGADYFGQQNTSN